MPTVTHSSQRMSGCACLRELAVRFRDIAEAKPEKHQRRSWKSGSGSRRAALNSVGFRVFRVRRAECGGLAECIGVFTAVVFPHSLNLEP